MSDPTDGTAASGIGLAIMTGLEKVWQLWAYINSTRDMLANHITTGSHTAAQITSGILDAARIPIITLGKMNFSGGTVGVDAISIGGTGAGVDSAGNASFGSVGVGGALVSPYARANPVTAWVSLGIDASGRIGATSSARRFKKNIKKWSPERQAVLAMQLVSFHAKATVFGKGADVEEQYGLIADDLDKLGLTWLVFYDDDGQPLGVHYDRIALALLPLVQDHEARIAELEKKAATNA